MFGYEVWDLNPEIYFSNSKLDFGSDFSRDHGIRSNLLFLNLIMIHE